MLSAFGASTRAPGYDAPFGPRVWYGVRRGLLWATGLSVLLGGFIALAGGVSEFRDQVDIEPLALIVVYFQACVLGAGLFYGMRPLHRTLPGVLIAGYLAGVPVLYQIASLFDRFEPGPPATFATRVIVALVGPLAAGPMAGVLQWWHDADLRAAGADV